MCKAVISKKARPPGSGVHKWIIFLDICQYSKNKIVVTPVSIFRFSIFVVVARLPCMVFTVHKAMYVHSCFDAW